MIVSMYDAAHKIPMDMEKQNRNWAYMAYRLSQRPGWDEKSRDARILDMILIGPSALKSKHIHTAYSIASAVKNAPNVLFIRFEDHVGMAGGGSDERKRQTLEEICRITNTPIENIQVAMEKAWGNPVYRRGDTFNKGKIGRWRAYFTDSHVKIMKVKNNWDYFLRSFGYEQEKTWHR